MLFDELIKYWSLSRLDANIKPLRELQRSYHCKHTPLICSFNLDTPPSENDGLEPRDTILSDSITVDRDNKGLISTRSYRTIKQT